MEQQKKILVEVTFKGEYCLLCFYMEEAVLEVIPLFSENIIYRRIDFGKKEGKRRFLELSEKIYGGTEGTLLIRTAPVPSLFIEGEIVFDSIPTRQELEEALSTAIHSSSGNPEGFHMKELHIEVLSEGEQ